MAGFDGNGNFVRTYTWETDAANGINITASRVDTEDDGFATGLSTCVTKDGQTTPTADLKMATFKHLNVGTAVLRNQYAALGQVQDSTAVWGATATGTADALVITLSPAITAYVAGQTYSFIAASANTTSTPTIAISGLTAKTITKQGTTALAPGDIAAGAVITVTYDGTEFQLIGVSYPPGKETISVPAAAIIPTATNGCTNLIGVEISALQPNVRSLDFDSSTVQYAEFSVVMPKSWDAGAVTAKFYWTHPATTTNFDVVWGMQGVDIATGAPIGVSYGTGQVVTSTGGVTNDLYISSATAAITIGGTPLAGDLVYFKVYRFASDAADTLAVNAKLIAVRVLYNTISLNDS